MSPVDTAAPTAGQAPPTFLRSRYVQLRALLTIAPTAVAGLTVALVLVATSNSSLRTPAVAAAAKPLMIRVSPAAELGAKLDHSERRDSLASAELGARLDHSGRLQRLARR
jgi:hypothetical protein